MQVGVNRDLCAGLGNCVAIAPTVFELDDDKKAVVLDSSSIDEYTLLEAAENCTQNAIIIEDNAGIQLYP